MKHKNTSISILRWVAVAGVLLMASGVYAAAPPPAVVTQMYDNQHTGWAHSETRLTVANVKSNFELLFKDQTSGQTYAQPLYVPALKMGKLGTHNVIFVATENNIVYAFDADKARAPLWSVNLTPSGETLQVGDDYDNDRIPQIGITGTPVIDLASATLYAVAASKTTASTPVFHQRLHALNITNGQERTNSPVDITARSPGTGGTQDGAGNVVFDPLVEFNRTALTLFAGNIYTAWSAHEDNGVYQGWVIAYDKTTLAQVAVFNDSPNLPDGIGGGSIWQASVGLVADDASIYGLTANGQFDANTGGLDYGDSALRLGPALNVADYFTPCNQQVLDDLDVDLGSGGMMILPDQTSGAPKLITFAGKEGSIYLVDRTAMGGYTPPQSFDDTTACADNVVQKLWRVLGMSPTNVDSNRDAFWGAPAYFRDSSGHQYIYYPGDYSPITEYDLANGTLTAGTVAGGNPNQTPSSEFDFPHGGTIPVVSSNGGDTSTAIVWAIRRADPPSDGAGPLTLDAFSATDLTNQLVFDIPAGSWNFHNDAFLIPTIANGKVYVSSGGELDVFGVSSTIPSTGSIRLNKQRINFGKVASNTSKSLTLIVKNAGNGNLHVTIGSLQAPYQVQNGGAVMLSKDNTATVTVVFTPTVSGVVPPQTLTITSDDPKHPSRPVTIVGSGK
jgi:hypothetical protein